MMTGINFRDLTKTTSSGTVVIIAYNNLIEELNRFGRRLLRHCKKFNLTAEPPPFFYQIRFFRNKSIEHWEDHVPLPGQNGVHLRTLKGKLSIPTFQLGRFVGNEKKARMQVVDTFKRHKIEISLHEKLLNQNYSDEIYSSLIKINKELNTNGKFKEDFNSLAEALWNYEFPLPFYEPEKYIDGFCNYLSDLLLKMGLPTESLEKK